MGLSRLLSNRRGTAEIVGSIMFLLILLFFFTNVYLWHDTATRQMDGVMADRMNSRVSIVYLDAGSVLAVTNNGGVGVALSRLWIMAQSGDHYHAELENITGSPSEGLWIEAGSTIELNLYPVDGVLASPLRVEWNSGDYRAEVYYSAAQGDRFRILTTLGNSAACQYVP
jgi:hypothetical protein